MWLLLKNICTGNPSARDVKFLKSDRIDRGVERFYTLPATNLQPSTDIVFLLMDDNVRTYLANLTEKILRGKDTQRIP